MHVKAGGWLILTSSHENGRHNHQFLIVAPEDTEEPENDTCSGQNGEADGNSTDTDANRVMAVDVKSLGRPEHKDGEEVGPRDKCDHQSQGKNTRFLL